MTEFAKYTAGKDPDAVKLLRAFRDAVLALGESDERVNPSEIAWARKRVFAAAFINGAKLEVAIDLLKRVEHPQLREAFATTKKVTTNRFWLARIDQLDASIREWLKEAYETVGPGTR